MGHHAKLPDRCSGEESPHKGPWTSERSKTPWCGDGLTQGESSWKPLPSPSRGDSHQLGTMTQSSLCTSGRENLCDNRSLLSHTLSHSVESRSSGLTFPLQKTSSCSAHCTMAWMAMMGRREQSHSGLGRTQNLSALSAGRLRVHCRALELWPAESETRVCLGPWRFTLLLLARQVPGRQQRRRRSLAKLGVHCKPGDASMGLRHWASLYRPALICPSQPPSDLSLDSLLKRGSPVRNNDMVFLPLENSICLENVKFPPLESAYTE